jgi:hypothetical protein
MHPCEVVDRRSELHRQAEPLDDVAGAAGDDVDAEQAA